MHKEFAQALLNADQPVPTTVAGHPGRRARFNVYRNNVRVSLTEALAALFPVCKQLVGDEFFNAMAGLYIEQSPPASPLLTDYGDTLPDFIEGFAPADSLPWLADMSRLELAVQRVQHAADTSPMAPQALQALLADPERLASHRLKWCPASALLHSSFAVGSIWLAHHGAGRLQDIRTATPEHVLLLRAQLTVRVRVLTPADATFAGYLHNGTALGAALEHTAHHHAGFDPAPLLQCLLAHHVITGVEFKGETS